MRSKRNLNLTVSFLNVALLFKRVTWVCSVLVNIIRGLLNALAILKSVSERPLSL